jgi:release factor glutamine methyltransferase
MMCESVFGLSRTDLLINNIIETPNEKIVEFNFKLNDLKQTKPIQYILKEAHFYERVFQVNEHVLIPRQETEELIQLILKNTSRNVKIMDIGSGSGIIPITLNKELPKSQVWGVDVSTEAIKVAKINAKNHSAKVSFIAQDILDESKWSNLPNELDIIVSNPPYVLNSEKELMHDNVLDYEPHLALFVENDNPLLFYKAITSLAAQKLKVGGSLYFEINEQFGEETANLLKTAFRFVKIIKDINGKDRFVSGIKE